MNLSKGIDSYYKICYYVHVRTVFREMNGGVMAMGTISFIIEEDQLAQVDELANELGRSRSNMLRRLIALGLPVVQVRMEQERQILADRVAAPVRYAAEVK